MVSIHKIPVSIQLIISVVCVWFNDEVIRLREYLLFLGIPSLMVFLLNRKRQCTARTDAVHCKDGCSALQGRMQCTAGAVAVHCL